MKKMGLIFCAGLCVIALSWFSITYGTSGGTRKKADPVDPIRQFRPVVIEKVHTTQNASSRSYPGSVNACRQTQLAFRVGGPLTKVNMQPGDLVKKDQVLMQIDPRDFQDSIRVLEARLAGARSQQDKATDDFERAKTLFDQKVIPQADFDFAKSGYDTAAASVEIINAQLQIARHQLNDAALRAPYDGIITFQRVEDHEMIQAGQVVLGLHDISHLEIRINVPENEIARLPLKKGRTATVEFPAAAGKRFTAELKEWNTAADPVTRSYEMTFSLPAPEDAQILPGMTANILWNKTEPQKEYVSVPVSAVFADQTGGSCVWVYHPASSTATKRPLQLSALCGSSRMTVLEGLLPGELIVTDGTDFITEGMKLSPVK